MKRSSVTDEMIARAIASGARVLTTRLPEAPATSGPFAVEFHVVGRPVPWKAPSYTSRGKPYKNKNLVAWQRAVSTCARMAMMGHKPYAGPVEVDATFFLAPSPNGSYGDLSNLTKAAEDALQGVVIVNDRQVCRAVMRRRMSDVDGARVKVTAIEEE